MLETKFRSHGPIWDSLHFVFLFGIDTQGSLMEHIDRDENSTPRIYFF